MIFNYIRMCMHMHIYIINFTHTFKIICIVIAKLLCVTTCIQNHASVYKNNKQNIFTDIASYCMYICTCMQISIYS